MANGKIRDINHIIEERSINFLRTILPSEWIQRKMEPDYGIDIDLELFEYEDDVCVTLGEHVFLQVKGTETPDFAMIKPVGEQMYTENELNEMRISVLRFVIDVSLLKLVERMGSTIPVLLVVVDLKDQKAYYVCLNDYVRYVLPYRAREFREQNSVTLYIPTENVFKPEVASWYGKRAKLYGLFQELLTLVDNVQSCNAEHKVRNVKKSLQTIVSSDAWGVCNQWFALEALHKQLEYMLQNNLLNDSGVCLLDDFVKTGEDPSKVMVNYGTEPTPIPALVAAQATSCDIFLDQARAVCAIFEIHVRHMGLPTQFNWMLTH